MDDDSIELLVGLGNPGARYAATRHNAGFWFVDEIASRHGFDLRRSARFAGEVADGHVGSRRLRLLKPDTFMNESGRAVAALAHFHRIEPARILVAHDDIDLPAGDVRLKRGGGDGGHRGLRDIIPQLGDRAFVRLRFGVGHPGDRDAVVGHVLHVPPAAERDAILDAVGRAADELPRIIAGDVAAAMNVLNRRERGEPE